MIFLSGSGCLLLYIWTEMNNYIWGYKCKRMCYLLFE